MWKKILAAGIIFSSSLFPFTPVEARQVRQDCVKISGYDWKRFNDSIVVGRKVYNPDASLFLNNPPYEITCKLLDKVSIVNVSLAIPDNSAFNSVKVQFYIEGNLAKTVNVFQGSVSAFSVDLRGVTNFSVTYQFVGTGSGRDNNIYLLQWDYN